jgi:response regulator RpfG family c-di-GMP phosphodiesterase
MDVQMPEMNGYQATEAIRALPDERARVPILALTANALQDNRDACLAVGMNDFISKPVDKERLLKTIALWLRCEAPISGPAPDETSASEYNALHLLDETVLKALVDDTDEEIMRETVAIFFVETGKRINAIRAAAGNLKVLEREGHAIKSGARTIGALRLAEASKDLESAAALGDPNEAEMRVLAACQIFNATMEACAACGLPTGFSE